MKRERVLDVYKVMGILQCWLYMNKEMGEPVYLASRNWLERESSQGLIKWFVHKEILLLFSLGEMQGYSLFSLWGYRFYSSLNIFS